MRGCQNLRAHFIPPSAFCSDPSLHQAITSLVDRAAFATLCSLLNLRPCPDPFSNMPSVPAAVMLLVLSAARWQITCQQNLQPSDEHDQSSTTPVPTDFSTPTHASTNSSLTTAAATELLSSALLTLVSASSSLVHSLLSAIDALHVRLSSLSLSPLLASVRSLTSSPPHDHTIPVLLFLVVLLLVLLVVLTCLTLGAWQRYAAAIAAFKDEWHSTRARQREKRAAGKRDRLSGEGRESDRDESRHAAAAVAAGGANSSSGRQTSEHLYGFIGRARAISEADDEMEMKTPTVVVPGRDPFSQLRRKN